MFLQILNPDNIDLQGFCNWLIPKIKEYANDQNNWDKALVEEWVKYFNLYDFGWGRDIANQPIVPSFAFIVDSYFSNQVICKTNGSYFIMGNKNTLLNYTDISIDSLAAMINDGTVDKKSYPFFEQVYEYFASRLSDYYQSYQLENKEV